jgi:hypothetical protein
MVIVHSSSLSNNSGHDNILDTLLKGNLVLCQGDSAVSRETPASGLCLIPHIHEHVDLILLFDVLPHAIQMTLGGAPSRSTSVTKSLSLAHHNGTCLSCREENLLIASIPEAERSNRVRPTSFELLIDPRSECRRQLRVYPDLNHVASTG